jgi:hypothetical protein
LRAENAILSQQAQSLALLNERRAEKQEQLLRLQENKAQREELLQEVQGPHGRAAVATLQPKLTSSQAQQKGRRQAVKLGLDRLIGELER